MPPVHNSARAGIMCYVERGEPSQPEHDVVGDLEVVIETTEQLCREAAASRMRAAAVRAESRELTTRVRRQHTRPESAKTGSAVRSPFGKPRR